MEMSTLILNISIFRNISIYKFKFLDLAIELGG